MAPDDDLPSDPFAPVALPDTGTGERARRRREQEARRDEPSLEGERSEHAPAERVPVGRRTSTRRRVGFVLALVVLIGSVPVLIVVGYRSVLNTTTGRTVDPVDDPSEAGYQANVTPTPVELVAEVGGDGALVGAVVLSLPSGAAGGSLLFLPAGTLVPAAGGGGTLASAFQYGEADGLRRAAAVTLRNGFDGVTVIDPSRWAELVAPLSSLAVTNPDRLPAAAGAPAFASGALDLAPEQVGLYLAARRSSTESDLNRVARQQLVWEAWLSAVAASTSPDRFPGETATGFGRFVSALVAGARTSVVLPVTAAAAGFAPRSTEVAPLLAKLIPFPTGDQPGDRVRVRVLDGVGIPGLTTAAAKALVPAGAEVAIIGNADHFGYASTEVLAVGDGAQAGAAAMQQALGVGTVSPSDVLDDVVEVTIVLGSDFATKAGVTTTTLVSTGSGGASG
jgi:hypothetical protein